MGLGPPFDMSPRAHLDRVNDMPCHSPIGQGRVTGCYRSRPPIYQWLDVFPLRITRGYLSLISWRAHYILGSGSFSIFLFMVETALCRSQQHYVTVLQFAPSSFMLLDGPPAAAEEVVMLSCICCQKQKLDDFTWHAVQQSGACMISHRQLVLPNR